MIIIKQSTAYTWKAGPFVDDGDGKTAETGLSIAQADIRLSKNGGDYAQTHNASGATHDELGEYDVPLDTTDTGTLGTLKVIIAKTGALPVWELFHVVTANVWDTLHSTDCLQVDVNEILGSALTETVAGYLAAAFKKLFDVATPVLTTASINQTGNVYPLVDAEVAAIKAKTDLIPASPAQEGTLNTVNGKVDSILEDTNMLQVDLVNGGRLDLLVDAIKAKTDLVPASPAAVGSKMDIVDAPSTTGKAALAAANADQVWDEIASGHVAAGSTGALLALMHSLLGGKQEIVSNQLICYAADNATEVARFNLFDANGDPSMASVYLRNRV